MQTDHRAKQGPAELRFIEDAVEVLRVLGILLVFVLSWPYAVFRMRHMWQHEWHQFSTSGKAWFALLSLSAIFIQVAFVWGLIVQPLMQTGIVINALSLILLGAAFVILSITRFVVWMVNTEL